ncbi:MAG: beta-propeller fold lactonase family protein [Gemmatimonadaceae bacterium]
MRRFIFSLVFLTSAATVMLLGLGACGSSEPTPPPPAPSRTIGVSVSGLTGSGLVLQNNGGNDLSIASDGTFTFTSAVAQGAAYAVTVRTQPVGQTCTVSDGSGTAGSANVTAVKVACTTTVAVTISGFVYVTSAIDPGNNTISAYGINTANGSLIPIAGSPFATGGIPDGVAVSPSGKFLVVPNETTQNVSVYAINANTGVLAPVPGSPFAGVAGGSPADAVFDRSGAFLYVVNSSTNNLTVYAVDINTGVLTLRNPPVTVGVQPQSLAVDPSGKYLLVANGGSNNVSVFAIDATTGALTTVAGSPFDAGRFAYDISFGAAGKYVYVENAGATPGPGSLSAFSLDPSTGALVPLPGSPLAIVSNGYLRADAAGTFLYVPVGTGLSVYSINATTGGLTLVAGSPFPAGNDPSDVNLDPSGRFVYVTNFGSQTVTGYAINQTTGQLTQVPGSPFAAGTKPLRIATAPRP